MPLLLLGAVLSGCDQPGIDCTVEELVPVLTIREVIASDGRDASGLRLSLGSISVDGGNRDVESIPMFANARVEAGRIACDVPCSFGVEQGTWSFTVQAEGFQDKTEERKALYKSVETECGPRLDGTRLDITLEPA